MKITDRRDDELLATVRVLDNARQTEVHVSKRLNGRGSKGGQSEAYRLRVEECGDSTKTRDDVGGQISVH